MRVEQPPLNAERHIAELGVIHVLGVDARRTVSGKYAILDGFDGFPAETRRENIGQQQCGPFFLYQHNVKNPIKTLNPSLNTHFTIAKNIEQQR